MIAISSNHLKAMKKAMKKQNNLKKIGLIIGGMILVAVLYFLIDRQLKPIQYPFTACQGEYCIKGNQMSRDGDCIVNERQERLCGWWGLTIDPKVQVNVQQ